MVIFLQAFLLNTGVYIYVCSDKGRQYPYMIQDENIRERKKMIKKLKHLFHSSLQDMESAVAGKQTIRKIFYISLTGFVLFIILCNLIDIVWLRLFMFPLGSVLFLWVAFCAWVLHLLNLYIKNLKQVLLNLTCPVCKSKIKYSETEIQIEPIKKRFDISKKELTKGHLRVEGRETVTAKVTCKCQSCGEMKSFTEDFITVICDKEDFIDAGDSSNNNILIANMERDLRMEWENGFDGSFGVHVHCNKSITQAVQEYFNGIVMTCEGKQIKAFDDENK